MNHSKFGTTVDGYYVPETLMSAAKIEMIAGAIGNRSPGCNLLVFGLGHDSVFWHKLNSEGYTQFIEHSAEWMERITSMYPDLNATIFDYSPVTVRRSLRSPISVLRKAKPPETLMNREWDVIIIDAPSGNRMHQPGRALPIAWAAQIAKSSTHIFVDDYNRDVERMFSDFLLVTNSRPNRAVLAPPGSKSDLFWSIGIADQFSPKK